MSPKKPNLIERRKSITPHIAKSRSVEGHTGPGGFTPHLKYTNIGRRDPHNQIGPPKGTEERRKGPFSFQMETTNHIVVKSGKNPSDKLDRVRTVTKNVPMTTRRVADLKTANIPFTGTRQKKGGKRSKR